MKLENINIREDFQQELPKIQGEPQLLQQVFFDLLVNARWAIKKKSKEGGLITIHTSYNAPAREVEVSVSDTGIGISRENLDKIFEPFFTTKEVGEGTGLGLSMVYSIVTNHNGTIRAESVLNKGATFNMRFPVQPV